MGQITPTLNCLKSNQEIENIKESVSDMKADIKMIKENHLHHIQADITEIRTDIKILLLRIG